MIKYIKKPVTLILLLLVGSLIIVQVDTKLGIRKGTKKTSSKKIKQLQLNKQNIGDKFNTLMSMTTLESVIPLLSSEFRDLIIKSPKNYSAIVIITDEEIQCKSCHEASTEFKKVAHSYLSMNLDSNRKLFFIRLDYYDASAILQDKINLNRSMPCILYFPTDSNFENTQVMDLKKYFRSADGISTWIRHAAGIIIIPSQKENDQNGNDNSNSLIFLLSVAFLLFQKWRAIKHLLVPESIPIFLMGVVIFFITGQVYNRVHGAPFALKGSSAGVVVIHPISSRQTILESFVVFALISTAAFGLIKLIDSMSKKEEGNKCLLIETVESASVVTNSAVLEDEEGWNGISGIIGAVCYFGSVYGLLYMAHIKMSKSFVK